jgi:hypothetical protein
VERADLLAELDLTSGDVDSLRRLPALDRYEKLAHNMRRRASQLISITQVPTPSNGKWRGELAQVTEPGLNESSIGIRKVNRVSACEEWTSIVPPCALAISLAM